MSGSAGKLRAEAEHIPPRSGPPAAPAASTLTFGTLDPPYAMRTKRRQTPLVPSPGLLFSLTALLSLMVIAGPAQAQLQEEGTPAGEKAPDEGRFTVSDALELTRVSDPAPAPDGSRVLFLLEELDWEENERPSRIWIVEADGSDARPFTAEAGDSDPRWSPDGRRVAFLRSVEREGADGEIDQLFLIRADGGEAVQLTSHPTAVRDFEWGPDSRRIFFAADDSLTVEEREAREQGYDAVFVNEGPHGQDRGQWSNLWWVPAGPGDGPVGPGASSVEAVPLTEGERIVGEFAVSPGGDRVAFTYRTENRRNDPWRSEIGLVDTETGEVSRLTHNEVPESDLAWAPDGGVLSFMAPDLEEWELAQGNLYAMEPASGEIRGLAAEFQGNIQEYGWSPDGQRIHFTALERVDSHVYRLDLETDEVRRMDDRPGTVSDAAFSADGRWVSFVHSSPEVPGQVYLSGLERFAPVRLTEVNPRLADRRLSVPERVTWESHDGTEIEGLLYLPAGGDGGAGALVLEVHGGPASVFHRGFDAGAQLLAAHGYAVLQPNVRGSIGYGDDFLRANMFDIGGGDYRDLMTGVDDVIERGVAHPDSLAVKGWSYGGILGGWTLTRTDRFRAASLGAMVTDWPGEFGAGFNFDMVRWYLGGDPWSNAEFWRERSSYTHMDRVETPTILFHGEEDQVDTFDQSMNFHQALRHFGVPTRFLRFPREGHGIQEPRHRWMLLVEELRWFQEWVRDDPDWQAPETPAGPAAPEPPGPPQLPDCQSPNSSSCRDRAG